MSSDELLFVYGTLRSDAGHPMRRVLASAGRRLGSATTLGTLLRVDWYPGLILTPATGRVLGELWQIRDRGVWPQLDRYEGCGPSDAEPHEYQRRRTDVETEIGRRPAWAYIYIGRAEGLDVIESGDWLGAMRDPSR